MDTITSAFSATNSRDKHQERTHLYFRPQHNMCIPCIRETKYPSKLVHGQLANIPNLQLRRLRAHLELNNLDLVCYDRGLGALVEGGVEHLDRVGMKLV